MAGAIRKIKLDLNAAEVRSVAMGLTSPMVANVTRRVLAQSKANTPVDTGNLRASQQMTMKVRPTYVAGTVETRVKYAHFVHDGTYPHIIRAKNRAGGRPGYLRFEVGGQVIFRRMVRHPGTKARPFLRTALRDVAGPAGFRITTYLYGRSGSY